MVNGVLQGFLDSYDVLQASYGVLSSVLAHVFFELRVGSAAGRQNMVRIGEHGSIAHGRALLSFHSHPGAPG